MSSLMHDLTMDQYQAHPAIGASTARLILKSPQLFADTRAGLVPRIDRPVYQIGTIAHMMILEPERFKRVVTCDGPINERTGQMYGRDTKAFAGFLADNPGVQVVEPWLFTMLQRMPAEIRDALKTTRNEVSIFADVDGVAIKCRPDAMGASVVYDLKTCVDVDNLERDITRRLYWFSAAWYRLAINAALRIRPAYRFIFCEKSWPFRWRIAELDAGYLMHGDDTVCNVVADIAERSRTGDWSDRAPLHVDVALPAWMEIEEDEDDGTL